MIRKVLPGVLLLAGLAWPAGAASIKIGVVDVGRVFSEYGRVEQAQAEFADYQEAASADLEEKSERLERMQERRRAQAATMTEEEDAALEEQIGALRQEIVQGYQRLQQDLQRKNRELVEARVAEILAAVEGIGRNRGLDLVVNQEAVLFSSGGLDLTDQVIAALNAPGEDGDEPATDNGDD